MSVTVTNNISPHFGCYVFVYGTLLRGQERDINRLQPVPVFIGDGQINGTLYDLGSYPGVRLGGAQCVQGEVYQVSSGLLRQLDDIEEVWPQQTGEYARREVRVHSAGKALTCQVYEVAEILVSTRSVITSGNWLKR